MIYSTTGCVVFGCMICRVQLLHAFVKWGWQLFLSVSQNKILQLSRSANWLRGFIVNATDEYGLLLGSSICTFDSYYQFIHSIEFTRDVSKEFLSNSSSMRGAHVKLISITVAIQCQLLYSTLLITMF